MVINAEELEYIRKFDQDLNIKLEQIKLEDYIDLTEDYKDTVFLRIKKTGYVINNNKIVFLGITDLLDEKSSGKILESF